MIRSARVLAVAAVISATAGISKATPIAPLTGVQTDSSNITQVYYRPYYHRYYGYYHRHYYRHHYGYYHPYYHRRYYGYDTRYYYGL